MNLDALHYPYASRRNVVFARGGMVATSQPLAAQAGLRVMQAGGNAIDAAVATAAALTVVEPTSNGIGGDAFALVWTGGRLHGLNASGPAGAAANADALRAAGLSAMPIHGGIPITVPGAPGAWGALSKRWGRLPLAETLVDAIAYAEDGFPVSPIAAYAWDLAFQRFTETLRAPHFKPWFDTFTPDGRAPAPGELVRLPDHAATLRSIATEGAAAFYQGDLAAKIADAVRQAGGTLAITDLARFEPEFVDPIHVTYRGHEVWELPPNGHGIVALMALNMLKKFEFQARDTITTYHRQIEAIKLAFADAAAHIADPAAMRLTVADLLSDAYADTRRALIDDRKALIPYPGTPDRGGTVYLCTADAQGNMVSFIQSNYMGFGSGIVVPGTGIALHNRGANFTLEENHPNGFGPGKRPYHTIIPGFLTKGGTPIGPFGVMGGFMQPQGHVQMIMNTIDFGLNPQASLDAPRWEWTSGRAVGLEATNPPELVAALAALGHEVSLVDHKLAFGRGQIIWRDAHGTLSGGTEPRTDGAIAAW